MVRITELHGSDLFQDYDDHKYSYAHCVSKDLVMGKGIATVFRNKYITRFNELQNPQIGNIVCWKNSNQYVYNLVTKNKYYNKPTYDTIKSSLEYMKSHAIANNINVIRMPKIGCGLDQLVWSNVKNIILQVFDDADIDIIVYII